nr:ComEC/Rec2 family competence protein [Agromyces seonyuensis]
MLPAIAVLAAAAALVASSAAAGAAARADTPLAAAAESGARVHVVVEASGAPRAAFSFWGSDEPAGGDEGAEPTSRQRLEARLLAVEGEPTAGVPVVLTAELPADGSVALGARLALEVEAERGEPADEAAYELTGTGTGTVDVARPPAWLDWAAGLRAGFRAAAAGLGGDAGALVPGLAIGDTSLVSDELDTAMKASSLSHLTAVSGANCALVTAGFLVVGIALRLPRGARLVLAATALAAFVVLVTPEASVVRAATMSVVVLVGLGAGRGAGGAAALGLALLVLLAVDPWLARDYGFALSVLATGGLLLLAAPLAARLAAWMPAPLALALAVPLAAQLACQPVLVLLDPAVAGLGVVANLLAAPAAPIGTVVGMLACLLLPFLPGPADWLLQLATLPAGWIAGIAHAVAAIPVNRVPWVPGALGALLLAVGTLAGLVLLLGRPGGSGPPTGGLRARRILAFALVVATLLVPLGALLGGPALTRAGRPGDWQLAQCDIGQGDAVLLRSEGRLLLIDTGPDPVALERCLALLDVDRIDVLVVTHWDADHAGGVAAVAGRVGTALVGPPDGVRSSEPVGLLEAGGALVVPVAAGLGGRLGGLEWRVRWPLDAAGEPGNDASVVLEVAGDGWRGVFLGDLGEEAQRALAADRSFAPVDVVKVAHHGSADQYSALYTALAAPVGLIGVGADNGYGHPTDRLLDVLRDSGTTALRSDLLGTLVLTRTDGGFALWSERSVPAAEAVPVGGAP